MFANIVWNPDKNLFILPYLNHPISWYGFLFAIGFLLGFFLTRKILAAFLGDQEEAMRLTDRLSFSVIGGAVLGARLGHVFLYDWSYFQSHPFEIIKVWQGGLASHGAALGVLTMLWAFGRSLRKRGVPLTFLALVDTLVIPVILAGGCIRVGNFINQEITGIPTMLPWGVIFLRPLDGPPGIPLHPVQLYEALFYFSVTLFLLLLWKRDKKQLGKGILSGWFFLLVFGFRFFIEYVKSPQNLFFDTQSWITMGQLLSIPFAFLGALLLIRAYKKRHAPC